jgi:DNA primase
MNETRRRSFASNGRTRRAASRLATTSRKRGVSDAVAERFGLGYAPDSWDALSNVLGARGFKPAELQTAGLAIPRKDGSGQYDRFRHR